MKTRTRIGALLLSCFLLLGCKQDRKKSDGEAGVSIKDRLVVEISLMMEADDVIEIFYRNTDETFTAENSLSQEIVGDTNYQTVQFVMDQFIFPSFVRIDLGSNPQQPPMIIDFIAF